MAEVKGRKKIYCDVCNTFISSEPLLEIHNNGKKHQRLLQSRKERKACTERSIYVRGFDNRNALENDLNEYFCRFGKVTNIFIDKEKAKYAIVEFESPTEAILTSQQLPLFFGKHLIIKKRTLKERIKENPKDSFKSRKEKGKGKTDYILDEEIIEKLKHMTTLDELVLRVFSSTFLTEDDLKLRQLIVEYLQGIFVEVFPGCSVNPFGSTTTGLGLKGADIDLCLLVEPEAEVLNRVVGHDDNLLNSSDFLGEVLEIIVNILRQCAAGFQNVVGVKTARCPVVKFVHRDSGLSCDLSVNNRLALRNTQLIKSYVALDDRIRPLAVTLKNWGAAKRLTGSGGRQISNYCLVLMLLHFLQRTRPPVIPVLQLPPEDGAMVIDDATAPSHSEETIIAGWDCSFMSTVKETTKNRDSLGTLLKGWFNYYGTFDYENDVITVQHGIDQRVLKASIERSPPQSSVNATIFKLSAVCVQDPLELSHNLTQHVSGETLRTFIQSCREAHTNLSSDSQPTTDGRMTKASGFIELFSLPADSNQRASKSFYPFTIPCVRSETFSCSALEQTCKFVVNLLNSELLIASEFQPDVRTEKCTPAPNALLNLESMTDENELGSNMCMDEDAAISEGFLSTSTRKRPHRAEGSDDLGAKRTKSCDESGNTGFSFLCKASQITWQNRRRQRRLQMPKDGAANAAEGGRREIAEMDVTIPHGKEITETGEQNLQSFTQNIATQSHVSGSTACMEVISPSFDTNTGQNTSNSPPVIEFKLTISEHTDKGSSSIFNQQCDVVLTFLGGSFQHFANFYAFFRKYVAQKIAECA